MWLRIDRVRCPLEALYAGPYKVSSCHSKHFVIELRNDVQQSVSIDCLKPAILSIELPTKEQKTAVTIESPVTDTSSLTPPEDRVPTVKTRSGRVVRFRKDDDFYHF